MTTRSNLSIKRPNEFFKSIRVLTNLHKNGQGSMETITRQVMGNLNYKRILYDGYEYLKGDAIDEKILEYAKAYYIKADLLINAPLVSQGQLEYYIHKTKGNEVRKVEAVFSSFSVLEECSNTNNDDFSRYPINFSLQLDTTWGNDTIHKTHYDIDFFEIDAHLSNLSALMDTIKPI